MSTTEKNHALATAIKKHRTTIDGKISYLTQAEAGRRCGIHETTLSGIINGRINPTKKQRVLLARLLRKTQRELFGSNGNR